MVGSPEAGARTQLALLGPQDYEMWLAYSDMYHSPYRFRRPSLGMERVYDIQSGSSNKKQAIIIGLATGLAVVTVSGLALYLTHRK